MNWKPIRDVSIPLARAAGDMTLCAANGYTDAIGRQIGDLLTSRAYHAQDAAYVARLI